MCERSGTATPAGRMKQYPERQREIELAPVPRVFRRADGGAGVAPDRRGGLDVRRHAGVCGGRGRPGYIKDGRDVYDNIQLIYKYPKGQKLIYTSISTNKHLALFGGTRTEFGELIMGTGGSIEITVGADKNPRSAVVLRTGRQVAKAEERRKGRDGGRHAGVHRDGLGALPILLEKDTMTGKESFLEREMKFARRWLYTKGVMVPEEDRNPVDVELESFLNATQDGRRPRRTWR